MTTVIYKIAPAAMWQAARAAGSFAGSADDLRDGYVHFSSRSQLAGTLERHFAGQRDLVLAAVDTAALGQALRWEASRSGTQYPHLYAALPISAVAREWRLELDAAGRHILPLDIT